MFLYLVSGSSNKVSLWNMVGRKEVLGLEGIIKQFFACVLAQIDGLLHVERSDKLIIIWNISKKQIEYNFIWQSD